MCGIAGIIDGRIPAPSREQAVQKMCERMLHRGPDDGGIESSGDGTIGMRRLAIFDPANGHQPMRTSDGRYLLVFNGAIYNFMELRKELEADGWSFRTRCDTEVLLAAFAKWKEDVLPRLRGMYAFAVWDSVEQSLFIARDPFGIKPLYYRRDGALFIFASEISALAASGRADLEIDPQSVEEYLAWLSVPAPRTIYRNVFSLRPGECARLHKGVLSVRSAWDFRAIPETRVCSSRPEFIRELRSRLDDTIRAHMLADVPVGAFLSGGLDSAVVTGLMTRAISGRLKTFSIGFEEPGFSESKEAEETARHLGADHHTRILRGTEVADQLDQILGSLDQPTGDGINTYFVSQAARAGGVKAALSGLGGDELFGGYPSFQRVPRLAAWLPIWRRIPGPLRNGLVRVLEGGDTRSRKLADILSAARNRHEIASLQRQVFSRADRRSLLSPDCAYKRDACFHPELGVLQESIGDANLFNLSSGWEIRSYMADVLLRDSDIMSMRHSLELRVPFIDRPLIEWLWRQPAQFKEDTASPKSALSEAAADVLPPAIRERRKRGFTLPFSVWMRRELKPYLDEVFSRESLTKSGLFASEPAADLWAGFISGNDSRQWSRLWSLAVLVDFVNRKRPTS